MFFFIKLGRHVKHDERINPIDFGGFRSKVKVTMDIYIEISLWTTPLCASSSNLADMLTMVRGWTLLILEVPRQRWRSWYMTSKPYEKFRWKVLGSDINIARSRLFPLQPMLDCNRWPLRAFWKISKCHLVTTHSSDSYVNHIRG